MPPNGFATSSPQDSLPPATLTSEASPMCGPMTCEATRNVIGSPGLEAGPSPCVSPDGPMTDLFGQAPAPASPSVPPARARRPMTSATCGLAGFLSSESAALSEFLESRLRRQLDGAGSTLFSLTWNRKATPAGRPYYQLVASALRTSGSDCGSWPTLMAQNPEGGSCDYTRVVETHLGLRASKNAPKDTWPSPQARDGANSRSGQPERTGGRRRNLDDYATLASWATPSARDFKSNEGSEAFHQARAEQTRGKPLSEQAHQLSGPLATGSPAQTEKRGQLSPDHSRWLMGYSADHLSCAPTAMPSSRKSRQSS